MHIRVVDAGDGATAVAAAAGVVMTHSEKMLPASAA